MRRRLRLGPLLLRTSELAPLPSGTTIDRIIVEKSAKQLSIFRDGKRIKTYRNGLGWIGAFHRWKNWTVGCITLTDEEIEELWRVNSDAR
jgi:hypothetical protein